MDLRTGEPVLNLDGVGDPAELTPEDRWQGLVRGGIPPEVALLSSDSMGDPVVLVGVEVMGDFDLSTRDDGRQ